MGSHCIEDNQLLTDLFKLVHSKMNEPLLKEVCCDSLCDLLQDESPFIKDNLNDFIKCKTLNHYNIH